MQYKLIEIMQDLIQAKMYYAPSADIEIELHLNLPSNVHNELMMEIRTLTTGVAYPVGFEPKFTTFHFMAATCYIQEGELKNKDTRDFLEQYEKLKQQHGNSN